MALMETGSMYQNAVLVADQIGLKNRVWAGYTDSYVAKNNESGSEDCSATDRSVFWRCKR